MPGDDESNTIDTTNPQDASVVFTRYALGFAKPAVDDGSPALVALIATAYLTPAQARALGEALCAHATLIDGPTDVELGAQLLAANGDAMGNGNNR